MKKHILFGLGLMVSCNILFSQLVSDTFLVSYTMQQVDSIYTANGIPTFAGEVNYPVSAYKIIYQTPNPSGDTTIASGSDASAAEVWLLSAGFAALRRFP